MFLAIAIGTPSSLMEIFGSGVITDLAEKSTRFPMRFPLILPCLPLRRSLIDLRGRPVLCATDATPGILLSTIVAT